MRVDTFMAAALTDSDFGYYRRADPLGRGGDFVSAPEVSQMFGELIGLWATVVWQRMGTPDPVSLVELGPGRGTLLADGLRAATGADPAFVAACQPHLVEISPTLRETQKTALATVGAGYPPSWHTRFDAVPRGPLLLIANEFFDALPIRQYVRTGGSWAERRVDADQDAFRFVVQPMAGADRPPHLPPSLADAADGAVVEVRPAAEDLAGAIGRRVVADGGAALVIDYGHPRAAPGDTLQAVRGHQPHPVLDNPGMADISAHVDFESLANAARATGAAVYGPTPQGMFLGHLGIRQRAERLTAGASTEVEQEVSAALARLVHPRAMGLLFKVVAIADPRLPPPPGFG